MTLLTCQYAWRAPQMIFRDVWVYSWSLSYMHCCRLVIFICIICLKCNWTKNAVDWECFIIFKHHMIFFYHVVQLHLTHFHIGDVVDFRINIKASVWFCFSFMRKIHLLCRGARSYREYLSNEFIYQNKYFVYENTFVYVVLAVSAIWFRSLD